MTREQNIITQYPERLNRSSAARLLATLKPEQYPDFQKAANHISVIAQRNANELGVVREPIGVTGKRHQITFDRDKLAKWILDEDRHEPGRPTSKTTT